MIEWKDEGYRNEFEGLEVCDYCIAGIAVYSRSLTDHENQIRGLDGLIPKDRILLCKICANGGRRVTSVVVYGKKPDDEAIMEQVVARMLNARDGNVV